MSADSFHHLVEEASRKKGQLNDFDDFVSCVNQNGIGVQMQPEDFVMYEKELGSGNDVRTPILRKVSLIQFQRGSQMFFFKREFNDRLKITNFLRRATILQG